MNINGYKAVITYDHEIKLFRGEFVNLNGGADFYADTVEGLEKEALLSLHTFLDVCKEKGIEPNVKKSGKFVLRLPSDIHEKATLIAKASGKSLNEWATQVLDNAIKSKLPA